MTEFVPENALEVALVAAMTDPAARPDFYQVLMRSDLFVIDEGPGDMRAGRHTIQKDKQLRVRNVDVEGIPHVPIFSSPARIGMVVQSQVHYIGMGAPTLFGIFGGNHLVLNPGFPCSKQFTPAEIGALLDGSLFAPRSKEVVQNERQVLLGQPATYPTRLVETLAAFFRRRKEVRAAYLAQWLDPVLGSSAHMLIGIDSKGDFDRLIGEASLVLDQGSKAGDVVDFVRIDNSDISRYMIKETKPFYRRKVLGLL
jgi:hypothetical protein